MNNKQTEALKMQLGDIIDGMRTKAINNVTIKSSTLERFADELNQFEIELHKAIEQPAKNIRDSFNEMLEDKVAYYKGKQPAQEPVAFIDVNWVINYTEHGVNSCYEPTVNPNGKLNIGTKLYTHPAPSNGMDKPLFARVVPWQGLSDDEFKAIMDEWSRDGHPHTSWGGAWRADGEYITMREFVSAIEQALKEKNHGS